MQTHAYRLESLLRVRQIAWGALFVVTFAAIDLIESRDASAAQPAVAPQPAANAGGANRPVLGVRLRAADDGKIVVSEVVPGGSADRAGIRAGDQLVSIGDAKIASVQDVATAISQRAVGKPVKIAIERGGQSRQVAVLLRPAPRPRHRAMIGVQLDEQRGPVTVLQTYPGGPAAQGGVQAGDKITAVDGRPVTNTNQLLQLLRQHGAGEKIDLLVTRNGWRRNFVLLLADRQQISNALKKDIASADAALAAQAQAAAPAPAQVEPGSDRPDSLSNELNDPNLRALDTDFD